MTECEKKCPIHYALNSIGDKWSLILIRDVMLFGKRYYNELLSSREGISTNILADRLAKLEQHGIFRKTRDPHLKNRFRYLLTEKGLELMPVLVELIYWGARHDKNAFLPADLLKQYEQDRQQLIRDLTERYHAVNQQQEAGLAAQA